MRSLDGGQAFAEASAACKAPFRGTEFIRVVYAKILQPSKKEKQKRVRRILLSTSKSLYNRLYRDFEVYEQFG